MLYWLYMFGYGLSRVLPRKASYLIAEIFARVFYCFKAKDKKALRANLRMILGEGASEREIKKHVYHIFRNFAKYLADFFKFTRFSPEYIEKFVAIKGKEHIDACLAEGKGAICLALHLGNWELGGAVVAAMGYPLSAIVLEHKDRKVNEFFRRQRGINNMRNIHIGMALKQCFKALKANELLAIVGDKDYTETGEEVEFFGKKTVMPKGAAVISLKTGAPLVITYLARKKDDTFELCFQAPIRGRDTGDIHKDVLDLMRRYLGEFEKVIRQYPDQWYAFKPIWGEDRKSKIENR